MLGDPDLLASMARCIPYLTLNYYTPLGHDQYPQTRLQRLVLTLRPSHKSYRDMGILLSTLRVYREL